jgi:hypothetical protein
MSNILTATKLLIISIAVAVVCFQQNIAVAEELPYVVAAQNLSNAAPPRAGLTPLTITANGNTVHIAPTVQQRAARAKAFADAGPLLYHSGGAIMPTAYLYAIFWLPASGKLQNGQATSLPFNDRFLETTFLQDYARHATGTLTTQYSQTIGTTTTYITGSGGLLDTYLDTAPYPASGCSDGATPGNCLTDAQIQTEIQRVMSVKGWTGGLNRIVLLFTSSGEGSCIGGSCAYTEYCAYHGAITSVSPNIIYANMPYGNLSVCQVPGTPSPNGNAAADAVISVTSHEVTEAITDPLLNAWYTAQGNEIGDLCNFNYGSNTWDGGKANQSWTGHFYEVQMEFDNHALACEHAGPL